MNNTKNTTTIPISINTDWTNYGEISEHKQRIEYLSFLIGGVFSLINRSTMIYEDVTFDNINPSYIARHMEDIRQVTKLGEALAVSMSGFLSPLYELEEAEKKEVENGKHSG